MIEAIFVLVITLMFIYYTAKIDYEHLAKNQYIYSHYSRWYQRFFFFVVCGIVNPIYGIAAGLLFTALFDQILNKLRGKKLWHLGTTAKWGIFFNKRKTLYITIKIISLLTSLILFLLCAKH